MSLATYLGIEHTEISPSRVVITLPVGENLLQPFGVIHGGINGVLAEEAASLGALANLDDEHIAVGVDLEVHHLASASAGTLVAIATPERIGRTLQFWHVEIRNADTPTSTANVILSVKNKPDK